MRVEIADSRGNFTEQLLVILRPNSTIFAIFFIEIVAIETQRDKQYNSLSNCGRNDVEKMMCNSDSEMSKIIDCEGDFDYDDSDIDDTHAAVHNIYYLGTR